LLVVGAAEVKGERGSDGFAVGCATVGERDLGGGVMIGVESDVDMTRVPLIEAGTMKITAEEYAGDKLGWYGRLGGLDEIGEAVVVAGGKAKHDVVGEVANGGFA